MRILGIDPGLKATGYGVIEEINGRLKVLEAGTITPNPRRSIPERLIKIHTDLCELIDLYAPRVLVLEKLYTHHDHPPTASVLGHVRGVICLAGQQKGLCFEEYSVKRIRKAVVGNGNASKPQVRRIVCHRLGIPEDRLTLDASDALALALGYASIEKLGMGRRDG